MARNWIVIASRTGARVFSDREFKLIAEFENEVARERDRAFMTGKPGAARNRTKSRASTYRLTGEKTPHDDVAKAFARDLKTFLTKQMNLSRFDEVLIAAEPRMMGWIKAHMGQRLKGRTEWLPKDLGKLSVHEVKKFLKRGGYEWPSTVRPRSSS